MILTYHEVVSGPSPYVYSTTTASMRDHLAALSGMRTSNAKAVPEITFDDGHRSHYLNALPLLNEFGFRGVFFVTAGWTATRPGYMNWTELAEMAAQGHEIQCHGWSHTYLPDCTAEALKVELGRSKATLEDHLGLRISSISMPGGRWNSRVLKACAAAGYERVYISNPFQESIARDGVTVMGRLMLRRTTSSAYLLKILSSGPRLCLRLRIEHMAKTTARQLIGDRVYRTVWNLVGHRSSRQDIDRAFDESSQAGRS